jgi:hypothetical protein
LNISGRKKMAGFLKKILDKAEKNKVLKIVPPSKRKDVLRRIGEMK